MEVSKPSEVIVDEAKQAPMGLLVDGHRFDGMANDAVFPRPLVF